MARTASLTVLTIGFGMALASAVGLGAQEAGAGSSLPKAVAAAPVPAAVPLIAASDYVISPDDELDVQVLDVPEASGVYRVSADGRLTLPLLSQPVPAGGLTLPQLSDEIAKELHSSGMVSHPRVTVNVKASRVHAITIAGAVKKPQIYPIFSTITLLDALSQAEGLADDAGETAIIARGTIAKRLIRQPPPEKRDAADFSASGAETQTVDLKRLLEYGDSALNITLYPGDRITVQRAGVVYVVGAVNKAGGFTLHNDREQMTILKAVALAGDLKSTASPKKAVIVRKDATVAENQQLPVNIEKILHGQAPDQKLLANDILFVPDSAAKHALHRAGEAAAEAAALMAYQIP